VETVVRSRGARLARAGARADVQRLGAPHPGSGRRDRASRWRAPRCSAPTSATAYSFDSSTSSCRRRESTISSTRPGTAEFGEARAVPQVVARRDRAGQQALVTGQATRAFARTPQRFEGQARAG
jgi:hypothetical protein